MGVRITKAVPADPRSVWEELSTIEHHVEWMADAVELRFHDEQRRGVGTAFSCVTKVGPLRTTDEMVIDRWVEGAVIGVAHRGVITGSGIFELNERADGSTEVSWSEQLRFPWWMGGPLGAICARPVLSRLWARNLEAFCARVVQSC